MGMDVDAVFARTALENIQDIVGKLPHGEREIICDEIIEFQDMICKKYGFPSAFKDKERTLEDINDDIDKVRKDINRLKNE